MKFSALLLSPLLLSGSCSAECPDKVEVNLESATKMSFSGFKPIVER